MKYNELKATLNVLNSPLAEVLKHCIITESENACRVYIHIAYLSTSQYLFP